MKRLLILVLAGGLSLQAVAKPTWYSGQVNRVSLTSGDSSFLVTMKNGVLDDCQHEYVYFYADKLGAEKTRSAYTLAVTSVTTGLEMGVVIDKSINGPGGRCEATGMVADLRAKED